MSKKKEICEFCGRLIDEHYEQLPDGVGSYTACIEQITATVAYNEFVKEKSGE